MDLREQQECAAERYRRTAAERKRIRRRQKESGSLIVDTAEQVAARAERLLSHGELGVEALTRAMVVGAPVEPTEVLERIVGAASELQSVNFLDRGRRAARTVARVTIRDGRRVVGSGSGFLVGRRLLLTNNHVLPDAATAGTSFVEFDDELDVDGLPKPIVRFELDPGTLFRTDEHLDMTLVAVRPGADGRAPGDLFGHNELVANQGKIVVGEPVNVVGHPEGRPKELAIRNNALLNQLPEFLHYAADTLPGDSGAPAFNDQWEVVALHHAGVPETVDGQLRWVANEGVRISVVLAHLAGLALPAAERAVLGELGAEARTGAQPVAPAPAPAPLAPTRAPVAPLEVATAGLTGRPLAGRQLVFLHGRGLLGSDPVVERANWAGGLARGLAAAGLPPVEANDVWFPFYADDLDSAVTTLERAPGRSGDSTVSDVLAPADPAARETYRALLQEAAVRVGMPAGAAAPEEAGLFGDLVAALQRPLSWLAARSGLDAVVIAAVFRDVAAYLDRARVREAVLAAVLADLPAAGEVVIVAHSLGSVVALDVLTRLPAGVRVPLLVTAGSPLGLDTVYRRLLAGGPVPPPAVGRWVNAWTPADAVAIGCPLGDTWPGVLDIRTDNPKDRPHDIREYLADGRVAGAVGALVQ